MPCLALPGVWSWKQKLHGKSFPIPDLERVTWTKHRIVVVFDSDLADKPTVAWAEHALIQELRRRGADVYVLRLPDGPRGAKLGLDDYLVAHGVAAFRTLPMLTLPEADAEAPIFQRMADLADAYLPRAGQPHHRLPLGYPELAEVLRGLAPGEVCTIIARPGVGKTALGLNLLNRMAVPDQLPALMFSLEQQGTEVLERVISLVTGWPGREVEDRARKEDPMLTERLRDVCELWQSVVIVDRPCTLEQIDRHLTDARASRLWAGPLRLVVVDYLGVVGQGRPGGVSTADLADGAGAQDVCEAAPGRARGALPGGPRGRQWWRARHAAHGAGFRRRRGIGRLPAGALASGAGRGPVENGAARVPRAIRDPGSQEPLGPGAKTVTLHFDPTSLRIEPGLPVAPAADSPPGGAPERRRGGVRYAKVSRVIWHDERFRAFTDDGKLAFLFLLTHPALTSVGAMRGIVAGLAAELGWPVRRLERALGPVQQAGMVEINAPAAFIGLPKFLRHNPPDNPNVVKAWVSVVAEHVPECPERAALLHRCRAALTGAFLDAFDQAIGRTFPQGLPEPSSEPLTTHRQRYANTGSRSAGISNRTPPTPQGGVRLARYPQPRSRHPVQADRPQPPPHPGPAP